MPDTSIFVCAACNAPSRGSVCQNPACDAGPNGTPEQIATWNRERSQRQAEEQERQRLARIRGACFGR